MEKQLLSNEECRQAASRMWADLRPHVKIPFNIYGVPRGGIPVAYLLLAQTENRARLVEIPELAHLIVDDIVASGATRKRYVAAYPDTPFASLVEYIVPLVSGPRPWYVFPWENGDRDTSADDTITRLLQFIGEDPAREGLKETPARVLKAWKEWMRGYDMDLAAVFKTFEDGGESYDEMVVVKDIPFYSHCEHHLAPFFGTATIAYIPDKRIVGLSKLGRVLEIFSRRLQVQERLTTQIANTIMERLQPKGVGVLIKARHLCMESRGIALQGHSTTTSALRGLFLKEERVRTEFLSIAR